MHFARFVCSFLGHAGALAAAALVASLPAEAQQVDLISRSGAATQGAGGQVLWDALSDDGRFLVFASASPNLVFGQVDVNAAADVFLYDRTTGSMALVSHVPGSNGVTPNGASTLARISADGNWVVFDSTATNIVAGTDTNAADDVFLYERATGTVRLVSHVAGSLGSAGNAVSWSPVVSADGAYVAFQSQATDLLPVSDGNGDQDVFLYERATESLTLVSHAVSTTSTGNGNSYQASISDSGDFVAFASTATDLVVGNFLPLITNVFVYERSTGNVALLSHDAAASTTGANDHCAFPAISHDGSYVVFESEATNLVIGQAGGPFGNVFLCERTTATVALASHVPLSTVTGGNALSSLPAISGDGRFVIFQSGATDLTGAPDPNGHDPDVFLYDRATTGVALVSHVSGSPVTPGNNMSFVRAISRDGASAAFSSWSTDLLPITDANGSKEDAFAYDTATGTVTLVSHAAGLPATTGNDRSIPYALSANGAFVAFESRASDLVVDPGVGDTYDDVFLQERATGTTSIASHPAYDSASANGESVGRRSSAISDDGRFVVFASLATNLVVGQTDSNGQQDVFVYDRATGRASLLSHIPGSSTITGNDVSRHPAISPDGGYVAFSSRATNLVSGTGPPGIDNVFLFDLQAGTIKLVSHAPGSPTTGGNDTSDLPTLSAGGNYVAFESQATNLVPGNDAGDTTDVFLYQRSSGTVALVSHVPGSPTTAAGGASLVPASSLDGNYLTFVSSSPNLVGGVDGNGSYDVFLYERASGAVSLVSHASGSPTTAANGESGVPPTLFPSGPVPQEISTDGGLVAFVSEATDMVGGPDSNIGWDVFLYRRATGAVSLVSHAAGAPTTAGNDYSAWPSLSADGAWVAFDSLATDLVTGVPGFGHNVFLYEAASGAVALVSHVAGSPTSGGNGISGVPVVDGAGAYVAFVSKATDLVNGVDDNGAFDVFLYERASDTVSLASHVPSSITTAGNGASGAHLETQDGFLAISSDGLRVALESDASDLVTGDLNGAGDLFLYNNGPVPVELQGFTIED